MILRASGLFFAVTKGAKYFLLLLLLLPNKNSMKQDIALPSLTQFLLHAGARDKSAKVAQCSLTLLNAFQKAMSLALVDPASLTTTVSTLGAARLSNDWLGHIGYLNALTKLVPKLVESGASQLHLLAEVLSKLSFLCYVTFQNVRWLMNVKLLSGDITFVLRTGFKFYTLGYLLDSLSQLIQAYAMQGQLQASGDRKALARAIRKCLVAALRSFLLVLQGAQSAKLIAWNDNVIAFLGLISGIWDCYGFWPVVEEKKE